MCARVAIVYNKPEVSRYSARGEETAVLGVLESVQAVNKALLKLGHNVTQIPLSPPTEEIRDVLKSSGAEILFNLFEGFCGFPETEALVPEIAEELKIPYTGCPGSVLRLALDKAKAKTLLKSAGIRTPSYQVLKPETIDEFNLSYPCIVKPRSEDASHGLSDMSVVDDFDSLKRQVAIISDAYGGDALVEEFVDGREFNDTALGNTEFKVLPPSEIVYTLPEGMPKLLTFSAKWEKGSIYYLNTQVTCPAQITPVEKEAISQTVLKVYRLFGCKGYSRVDMRLDKNGEVNVIEVNPNPDISPGTGAARQANAAGMTYAEFIDKIIQFALERDLWVQPTSAP
ncbi:MAG: ATP-grasp domain-containing protein [Dehalococcoidales bacterium]|nr:ATP-grasp domain-containing protein [Dehalococcoidales bacterium]